MNKICIKKTKIQENVYKLFIDFYLVLCYNIYTVKGTVVKQKEDKIHKEFTIFLLTKSRKCDIILMYQRGTNKIILAPMR